jgi:hypothetical protein
VRTFIFEYRDLMTGRIRSGQQTAPSLTMVLRMLQDDGIEVVSVRDAKTGELIPVNIPGRK